MSFSIFEGKISGILEICVKISNHLQEIESKEPWKATTTLHQLLPVGKSSNRDKSYFVDLSLVIVIGFTLCFEDIRSIILGSEN